MEAPKELEGHRFVGDKRNERVYDLETFYGDETLKSLLDHTGELSTFLSECENAYGLTNKRCQGSNDILNKPQQTSQVESNVESENNLELELLEIENYNM